MTAQACATAQLHDAASYRWELQGSHRLQPVPEEPINLCADVDGFSLHAAVRFGAAECQTIKRLRNCIARPALAKKRVQCNAAGRVVGKLKAPRRDGTTHVVMSPRNFMQLPVECPACGRQIHSIVV